MIKRALGILVPLVLCGPWVSSAAAGTASAVAWHPPIVALNANQSSNWSGYNQGTIEQGGKLFHAVTGDWTVPTASQHTSGQAEYSSTWIGIGGGCVDSKCLVGDTTLIQTGTEQDVTKSGAARYSAWWELIPAPSIGISGFAIHPGDHMHAAISEKVTGSEVWTIVLRDVTTGRTFTKTVPYTSSHLTAEWIEETPLVIGGGGSLLAPLPNLSTVHFDLARTNGAPAGLKSAEEIQLVTSSGSPLATPSSPDPDADGFNDCAHASSCPAPSSS